MISCPDERGATATAIGTATAAMTITTANPTASLRGVAAAARGADSGGARRAVRRVRTTTAEAPPSRRRPGAAQSSRFGPEASGRSRIQRPYRSTKYARTSASLAPAATCSTTTRRISPASAAGEPAIERPWQTGQRSSDSRRRARSSAPGGRRPSAARIAAPTTTSTAATSRASTDPRKPGRASTVTGAPRRSGARGTRRQAARSAWRGSSHRRR